MKLSSSFVRLAMIGLASAIVLLLLGRTDATEKPTSNHHEGPNSADDRIDEAIDESFPASDPPSYNAGLDRRH